MAQDSLKIISWNVNSIRSRVTHVSALLSSEQPDFLLLQETKCLNEQFPHNELPIEQYNIINHGQKSYNGVSILSKYVIDDVKTTFPNNPCEDQARFLEISCMTNIGYARVISVYVPNGGEIGSDKFALKLVFLEQLKCYLSSTNNSDEILIIGGDFNVAPFDIDTYSSQELEGSICCSIEEKTHMRSLLNIGLEDLYRLSNPNIQEFSWWDYRSGALERNLGLRIDMILSSSMIVDQLEICTIASQYRKMDKPSDHAPIIASFNKK